MSRPSRLALWLGGILIVAGLVLIAGGWPGWPPLLICGIMVVITALAEPIYGRAHRRPPAGADWRPTDEKFVDPETGKLVTVWFDPGTGERRYVADGERPLA